MLRALRFARYLTALLLGTVLAIGAALSAADSYWRENPDHAWSRIPASPGLRLAQSEARRAQPGWLVKHAFEVRANARDVLRREPLDAVALRQMGELELGSPVQALQLLRVSEQITRRDPTGQVLLINLEATQNHNAQALAHYDRALTIYPQLATVLLPVLASGLGDPALVDELSPYSSRPWVRSILTLAIDKGAPVSAVARLARAGGEGLAADERRQIAGDLIQQLLTANRPTDIRALVGTLGAPPRSILDDLSINRATADPRNLPLAWRLTSDAAVSAEFMPPSGFRVTVAPSGAGAAATRVSVLGPGSYELLIRLGYERGVPRARLAWTITCSDGRPIWRQDLAGDRARAAITVPAGCDQQDWCIDARADDSQFMSVARIESVFLVAR